MIAHKFEQVLGKDEIMAMKAGLRNLKLAGVLPADREILQKFFTELAGRIENEELQPHGFFGALFHLLCDTKRHPQVLHGIRSNIEPILDEVFWFKPEFAAE